MSFHEEISERAHAKWARRSETPLGQLQDWLEAEAELSFEAKASRQLSEARSRIVTLLIEVQTAEKLLMTERSVRRILATASTLCEAAPKVVQAVCEGLDWEAGVFWTVDRQAQILRRLACWPLRELGPPDSKDAAQLRTHPLDAGLPGRVWASRSILWSTDLANDQPELLEAATVPAGVRRAIGLPIRHGEEVVGIVEFSGCDMGQSDDRVMELIVSVSGQINQFVGRCRTESIMQAQAHDLRSGQEMQRGLLSAAAPRLTGFEVGGRTSSCNQVGGDCFDFFAFAGAESLGVLVADASGHGIGAALLAIHTCAFLRGLALSCDDVGELLELTNDRLGPEQVSDRFVTAFLMKLDAGELVLRYSNAGHLPGYVLDRRGRIRAMLSSTGLPLGIAASAPAPSVGVLLEHDDLILILTDGVVEAASPQGEPFGVERALRSVGRTTTLTPSEILDALFLEMETFCQDRVDDDATAVVVKVASASEPSATGNARSNARSTATRRSTS